MSVHNDNNTKDWSFEEWLAVGAATISSLVHHCCKLRMKKKKEASPIMAFDVPDGSLEQTITTFPNSSTRAVSLFCVLLLALRVFLICVVRHCKKKGKEFYVQVVMRKVSHTDVTNGKDTKCSMITTYHFDEMKIRRRRESNLDVMEAILEECI
ncbi:hypothetical protein WUBG_14027 [Wuchereria bancrofti]|uniref:Uncharacterized protein n=1 Tax=Wuchereria bancrofti TaxID=6293 RepID=J9EI68_WUCBA|nr:hypothetical protein WUBG_14027 [Wuchereria bancrofti]